MSALHEGAPRGDAGLDRTRPPAPGPLRPFHFPEVHRHVLPNGLTVLAAEARNFPVASFGLILEGGGTADDPARAGTAALVSGLLESGAGDMDADQLAEVIDGLGLSLDTGVSWDTAQAGLTAITSRLEDGCSLLADLVRRPHFPEDEVLRLRDERLGLLQQRRGTPSSLADEVENLYVYAPGLPYARPLGGLAETVRGLTRDDMTSFHAARYRPGGAALVAAGDVSIDDVVRLAERYFGDWEGVAEAADVDPRPRLEETTIVVADRPGSVQSELRVGHLGMERRAEDFFAVQVLNAILGGTFTSRLNMNLRERLGYTYGVSSSFIGRRRPGAFSISTAVQTEVTAHSVSEILRDMRELREAPVSQAELDDARNYLAGVFPLSIQTTDGLSGKLNTSFTYGLSDDYWDRYRDRMLAVTAEDVLQAAQRRLWPHRAAVVIAGDAAAIRGELEALNVGPVEIVDPATLR